MPKIQPYPLEFRQEAVRLLRTSGRSVPQLAEELGVSPQSSRNWSRQIAVGGRVPGTVRSGRPTGSAYAACSRSGREALEVACVDVSEFGVALRDPVAAHAAAVAHVAESETWPKRYLEAAGASRAKPS